MESEFEFKPEKLAEAVLFFVHRANNGLLSKTKLFKMLYYLDFDHFEQHGTPVTGETYLRPEHGPSPQHGESVLADLVRREAIREGSGLAGPYHRVTFQPLAPVDLAKFSSTEVKTLTDVLEKWLQHNTSEIVAATHGESPWIATAPNGSISYSLAYYRNKFNEMDEFLEEDAKYVISR